MARANKYETHVKPYLGDIAEWYGTMTERQIAKRLGIAMSSFENYKNEHSELKEALRKGRTELIKELKETLKMKAKGFHYKETKKTIRKQGNKDVQVLEEYERYSIPDTGAIHLLLKNLDEGWRNDDRETMDLKREKLEMEKAKADAENW